MIIQARPESDTKYTTRLQQAVSHVILLMEVDDHGFFTAGYSTKRLFPDVDFWSLKILAAREIEIKTGRNPLYQMLSGNN